MTEMITTHLRTVTLDPESIRADGDGRTITGQAVPYGVDQSIPSEGIVERFAPGAFAHQIPALHRVPVTYRHQSMGGEIVGRLASGSETDRGLQVEMRVSDTTLGRDVLTLVKDGAVRELSIGFRSNSKGSRREGQNTVVRTRANLFEVAIVPEGAYGRGATIAGVRSMDEMLRAALVADDLDEDDEVVELRADGMTVDEARARIARIPLLPASIIGR